MFLAFGKTHSGIPEFLQGLLCHVFDGDGSLRDEPSVDCIRLVRQICLFGKKIERPCSQERVLDATARFKSVDGEVAERLEGPLFEAFQQVAKVLMDSCTGLKNDDVLSSLVPKHGPKATREHISGNQKWYFKRWHQRLDEAGFTYWRFGCHSHLSEASDIDENLVDFLAYALNLELPDFVEPGCEEPVRVVFVPKTQKTPRVIAVEPVCMQYAQQALKQLLVDELNSSPLTSGRINFRNQSINQDLALQGSNDGQLATLDMSDASDRVSLAHVEAALAGVPIFRSLALASRSMRAELPSGDIVTLRKFASMGSALCFPIEALVFFTSIIASRAVRGGCHINAQTVRSLGRDVYVYGDDIVVPSNEAPAICDDLESLGFRVNRHKSFWNGKFRESCGADCYDGELVTPVYLRRDLPANREDVSGLLSAVSTCNQLSLLGFRKTAAAMREAVEAIVGKLPQTPEDNPAVGWHFHSEVVPKRRWNDAEQHFENRVLVAIPPRDDDALTGLAALAKCFSRIRGFLVDPLGSIGAADQEHLETSPRPYSLTLKRRWVPAF